MANEANELAILERLYNQAMNPKIAAVRADNLLMEETQKKELEDKRNELKARIDATDYSNPDLLNIDELDKTRVEADMVALDNSLSSLDNIRMLVDEEIERAEDKLYDLEIRINDLSEEWRLCSSSNSLYAENPNNLEGKKRPVSIIDDRMNAIEKEIIELQASKKDYQVRLRELVNKKVSIAAEQVIGDEKNTKGKLSDVRNNLTRRISANVYNNATKQALDDAELAVLDIAIKRCNENISRLNINVDKLYKKGIDALQSGSIEYNDLKEKLSSLSQPKSNPKAPIQATTYFKKEICLVPSKISLEESIDANRREIDAILVNIAALDTDNTGILSSLCDKKEAAIACRVIIRNANLKAETDPDRISETKEAEESIKLLEDSVKSEFGMLVENQVAINHNNDSLLAYQSEIRKAENNLFVLDTCKDINDLSYADRVNTEIASLLANAPIKKEVFTENVSVEKDISYEELETETVGEEKNTSLSFLDDSSLSDEIVFAKEENAITEESDETATIIEDAVDKVIAQVSDEEDEIEEAKEEEIEVPDFEKEISEVVTEVNKVPTFGAEAPVEEKPVSGAEEVDITTIKDEDLEFNGEVDDLAGTPFIPTPELPPRASKRVMKDKTKMVIASDAMRGLTLEQLKNKTAGNTPVIGGL